MTASLTAQPSTPCSRPSPGSARWRMARKLTTAVGLVLLVSACGGNESSVYDDSYWQPATAPAPDYREQGAPVATAPQDFGGLDREDDRYFNSSSYLPRYDVQESEIDAGGSSYDDLADPSASAGQQQAYNWPGSAQPGGSGTAATEAVTNFHSGRVKIAMLVPLTGRGSEIGKALYNAAQMALFSIGATDVVLMPKDTQANPATAAAQARAAINEGANLIIGPLFSDNARAIAPITRPAGVSVITFSNDRSVAQPGVYLMGFQPEQQVARVVQYAHQTGLRRFAALFPEGHYGRLIAQAFYGAVTAQGDEITRTQTYPRDPEQMFQPVKVLADYDTRAQALDQERKALEAEDNDFSKAALKRLEGFETLGAVDFEAVLLPEGGTNLLALAPLLPYYDVDPKAVRFLGTGAWNTANIGREPALVGGWFAAPAPALTQGFETQYKKLFGGHPPRLATMGFDAVALAVALKNFGGAQGFGPSNITRAEGFSGLDGIIRFHWDGQNERGFAVLEVQEKGLKVVSPAPARFDAAPSQWRPNTPPPANYGQQPAQPRQQPAYQQPAPQQPANDNYPSPEYFDGESPAIGQ